MIFRTEIEKPHPKKLLNYKHKILALGSCFVENICKNFEESRMEVLINPFGTIFNPHSIFKLLDMVLNVVLERKDFNQEIREGYIATQLFNSEFFVQKNGVWVHLDFHSDFWGETKEILSQKILKRLEETITFLQNTDVLILTFGTAWVYEHRFLQKIVSNCHHMPQKDFDKYLLTIGQIESDFGLFFQKLKKINPNIHIYLTLSPVRHQKDSLALNQVSKSILRCAIHGLLEKYQENISYIPAYEILLDDLRDYRFYAEDLIHPNLLAENYIWEYVQRYFLDTKTQLFIQEWQAIQKNLSHKPRNPASPSHLLFVENNLKRLKAFEEKYV